MKQIYKILMMAMLPVIGCTEMSASSPTYIHRSDIANQVRGMEMGAGNFNTVYYDILHPNYGPTANATNKLAYRTEATAMIMQGPEYAEQVDSVMRKRAIEEALDLADITVDLAILSHGPIMEKKQNELQEAINKIQIYGGSRSLKETYEEYLKSVNTGFEAVKSNAMPNSKRAQMYQDLEDDLDEHTSDLNKVLSYLYCQLLVGERENAKLVKYPDRVKAATDRAYNRWMGTAEKFSKKK